MSDTHPTTAADVSDAPIELGNCGTGAGGFHAGNTCAGGGGGGQLRAKAGGEEGPNGEWYPGGAFIATTTMPKAARFKRDKAAKGRKEIEPFKYEVPAAGKLPIYSSLMPGVYLNGPSQTINEDAIRYYSKTYTPEQQNEKIDQAKRMLTAYKAGDRFVDANEFHHFIGYDDAARMAIAGMPIPGAALDDMARVRGISREDLEKQLGVTRFHATPKEPHAMSRESLYLSAAAVIDETPRPALTLGQGLPTHVKATVGGVEREYPVSYWKKDAIAVGKYRHPVTGQAFDVDHKRIDGWVSKLKAMRAANREIPTPATHSDDPRDNMGWVIDAERVGDRLALTLQVIGDDGAIAAARNACSVKIDPNYIDETGKSWGDAIVHSAFTPVPVITGMGSFVPFAASRDRQTETPIYYLSAEKGDPEMDLKALREALGAAADVPDDKLPDLAVQRLAALKTDAQTALSRAEQAETKVTTLSRTPAAPDPETLRDRMELSRSKIDLAVERGDMPPFIADKLKGKVGDAAKPSVFMLSRSDDLGDRPVDFVLSLFDGAKLNPKTGSQTGVQTLSREVPGGNQADADAQFKAGRDQAAAYEKTLPPRN